MFDIIVIESNITIQTTQEQAVIGKPVKWKKQVLLEKPEEITIKLPAEAENITVKKIIREKQGKEIEKTGEVENRGRCSFYYINRENNC